jgi:ArsR family transcriptional regulator, arsenate/arsenite/antimonite-responsive transcriptional repressor
MGARQFELVMIQSTLRQKSSGRRAASLESRPLAVMNSALEHLDDDIAQDLVQCFKLFADETRLRILYYLMQQREMHVRALCTLLEQSQPAVSHHLALLRVAGFIDSRRDGKHNFYHLAPKRFHDILRKLFGTSSTEGSLQVFENYVLTYGKASK